MTKNSKDTNTDPEDSRSRGDYHTPRGVHDILPDQHDYFNIIKRVLRHRFRQCGYRRISTPIFEDANTFKKTIGINSDIVSEQLFSFTDPEKNEMALRPDGTVGIMRAYMEHGLSELPQPVQLYYIEPFFRFEDPQKGRYRQFNQFGFEIIGESDPALDAQVISFAWTIMRDLGLADRFTVQINSLGTAECRKAFAVDFANYFEGKERNLCQADQALLKTSPLRLLDSTDEDTQILVSMAPKIDTYLDDESKDFHEKLLAYLDELGVPYVKNPTLLRPLGYYNQTVFEFWDNTLGSQNAVGGGGRYDNLSKLLGGDSIPGVGFAAGIERLMLNMKTAGIEPPRKDSLSVFVAQLGPEAKKKSLSLLSLLRNSGIRAVGALGKGSMKDQLGLAEKFEVAYALILGQLEVMEGTIIIRDMKAGKQKTVKIDNVLDELLKMIPAESLDKPVQELTDLD